MEPACPKVPVIVYDTTGSLYCLASSARRAASAFFFAAASAFSLAAWALAAASFSALAAAVSTCLARAASVADCVLLSTWTCWLSACAMIRSRSASPASLAPWSVVSSVLTPTELSAVAEPLGASEEPPPNMEPTEPRSGMEMDTGGLPVLALAMPPAPTAAMTPTPRTVELRASPPPRCLPTRCRPRTGRTDSSVGFHSSHGPSSSLRGPEKPKGSVPGTNGAAGAGGLDATWARSFPSFSPTGLADGFGAGRSPTRVYRSCFHDGIRAIHPRVLVPRFPCGIRRVRTEPPLVTAGTTALRYRTLIDPGCRFQAVPLD